MPARAGDEDGFSLIELLIAIVILGTGVVAVLAAMTTSITAADLHRSLAGQEIVARDFADALRAKALAAPVYAPCPGEADLLPAGFEPGHDNDNDTDGSDYEIDLVSVQYWRPTSNDPRTGGWVDRAACEQDRADRCEGLSTPLPTYCDAGSQRVTFTVTSTNTGGSKSDETLSIVLRRGQG